MTRPKIVGIVNLTTDSFSDGGRFIDAAAAISHGEALLRAGADLLDLGAESSNPAGTGVPDDEQIRRLVPVVTHFVRQGARIAIDTFRPNVMAATLDAGATMINDITALADAKARAVLMRFPDVAVVLMHNRSHQARATTTLPPPEDIVSEIEDFFRARICLLTREGLDAARFVLDPGMGFFLAPTPEPSLRVLRALPRLRTLGFPLYVSTSRKSFVGAMLGGRDPMGRGAGTLATELWAAHHGADYLRTHDVATLADALTLWEAIAKS